MSLKVSLTETKDFAIFTAVTGAVGFEYTIPPGAYDHVMMVARGQVQVTTDDKAPEVVRAPGVVRLREGSNVFLKMVTERVVFLCIHNKTSPKWNDAIDTYVKVLRWKNAGETVPETVAPVALVQGG